MLIQFQINLTLVVVNKNIDAFLIPEAKIDSSFPAAQLHIEGYTTPYRLDRYIWPKRSAGKQILLCLVRT